MHPHLAGYEAEDHVAVFQLHSERRIGKVFYHLPCISIRSSFAILALVCLEPAYFIAGKPPPLKLAFLSRLSY